MVDEATASVAAAFVAGDFGARWDWHHGASDDSDSFLAVSSTVSGGSDDSNDGVCWRAVAVYRIADRGV